MEAKYTIRFMRNEECLYNFDYQTNKILRALWHLLILSLKYPFVDFEIRRGYTLCDKCDAAWCDKSPVYEKTYVGFSNTVSPEAARKEQEK